MLCYHGSPVAGINTLTPPPGGPLYLTNNRAYAMFYIRDMEINWVTCGVRDGVVVYDELFPDQLRTLYAGRGGWLYASENDGFAPGNSPWIVLADKAVPVVVVEYISDAYEAILREIDAGTVRVDSYDPPPACVLAEDGNGINLYAMSSVCWRGLQEILARVSALERR